MDRQEWLQSARDCLIPIAEISSSYARATEELRRRVEGLDRPEDVHLALMTGYIGGREFEAPDVSGAARKVLQLDMPDLEERLPYYEVMFDIIHNGEYTNHPTDIYWLEEARERELTAYLAENVGLDGETASRAMYELRRGLGDTPGKFLYMLLPDRMPEVDKMMRICQHLFLPHGDHVTVDDPTVIADIWYDYVQETVLGIRAERETG